MVLYIYFYKQGQFSYKNLFINNVDINSPKSAMTDI